MILLHGYLDAVRKRYIGSVISNFLFDVIWYTAFDISRFNGKDYFIRGHVNYDGMDYKDNKCYIYVAIFDATSLYIH